MKHFITVTSSKGRKRNMFMHINREEIIQFPTDHNGVSSIENMFHQTMDLDRMVTMVLPNDVELKG